MIYVLCLYVTREHILYQENTFYIKRTHSVASLNDRRPVLICMYVCMYVCMYAYIQVCICM